MNIKEAYALTLWTGAGDVDTLLPELLSKLEGRGLIERVRDEADNRRVLVHLTAQGRAEFDGKKEEPSDETLMEPLEETEQAELNRLLTKLLDVWEEKYEPYKRKKSGKG